MQAEIKNVVDVVNKANTQAFEAAKEVAAINSRAIDKLVRQQLELVGFAINGGVKQLELLGDTKGYNEYFAAQAELAQEGAEKVIAAVHETLGVLTGARDELNAVVEKGVEAISAQAKPAQAKKVA
ncbi:MAG: phasin family protein [Acidiferrobacterales bacterium]